MNIHYTLKGVLTLPDDAEQVGLASWRLPGGQQVGIEATIELTDENGTRDIDGIEQEQLNLLLEPADRHVEAL